VHSLASATSARKKVTWQRIVRAVASCPTSNNNSNEGKTRFTGNCYNCGKSGHKSADCWQKEENNHKHPKAYSPGGVSKETGGAAVDNGSKVQFLLWLWIHD
jgi:hypothetical protein